MENKLEIKLYYSRLHQSTKTKTMKVKHPKQHPAETNPKMKIIATHKNYHIWAEPYEDGSQEKHVYCKFGWFHTEQEAVDSIDENVD